MGLSLAADSDSDGKECPAELGWAVAMSCNGKSPFLLCVTIHQQQSRAGRVRDCL